MPPWAGGRSAGRGGWQRAGEPRCFKHLTFVNSELRIFKRIGCVGEDSGCVVILLSACMYLEVCYGLWFVATSNALAIDYQYKYAVMTPIGLLNS